jgi:ketosteroid isomerase-like protein
MRTLLALLSIALLPCFRFAQKSNDDLPTSKMGLEKNEFRTVENSKVADFVLLTDKTNLATFLAAACSQNSAAWVHPGEESDDSLIRKLEERERQAILKSDTVELSILMSKQIVVLNPENIIVGFQQILNRIRNGKISYSSFERNIEKISFVNGIAVAMGLETLVPQGDTRDAGKTVKRRFTNIWTKEKESWKLTARQATIVSIN